MTFDQAWSAARLAGRPLLRMDWKSKGEGGRGGWTLMLLPKVWWDQHSFLQVVIHDKGPSWLPSLRFRFIFVLFAAVCIRTQPTHNSWYARGQVNLVTPPPIAFHPSPTSHTLYYSAVTAAVHCLSQDFDDETAELGLAALRELKRHSVSGCKGVDDRSQPCPSPQLASAVVGHLTMPQGNT